MKILMVLTPIDPKSDLPENQNPASSTAAAKSLLKLLGRPSTSWSSIEVSHEHAA